MSEKLRFACFFIRYCLVCLSVLICFAAQARERHHEVCNEKSNCFISAIAEGPDNHLWMLRGEHLLEYEQGHWWRHSLPYEAIDNKGYKENRFAIAPNIVLDRYYRPLLMIFDRLSGENGKGTQEISAKIYRLNEDHSLTVLLDSQQIHQRLNAICYPFHLEETVSYVLTDKTQPCPYLTQLKAHRDSENTAFAMRTLPKIQIHVDSQNQIHLGYQYRMLIDSNGHIWRGDHGLVLNRQDLRTRKIVFYPEIGDAAPIAEDKAGNIWFLAKKHRSPEKKSWVFWLIKRNKVGKFISYPEFGHTPYDRYSDFMPYGADATYQWGTRDQQGYDYWLANKQSVSVFYQDKWQDIYFGREDYVDSYIGDAPQSLALDHRNVLWIITKGGVARLLPALNPTQRQVKEILKFKMADSGNSVQEDNFWQNYMTRDTRVYVDQRNVKWFFRLPGRWGHSPGLIQYIDGQGISYYTFE